MGVFRPSLRTILILAFIFISAAPLVVLTGWLYAGIQNRVMKEAKDKNQLLSENLANPVYQYLKAAQRNLGLMAVLMEKSNNHDVMSSVVSAQQYFSDVMLFGPNGSVKFLAGNKIDSSGNHLFHNNPTISALLSKHAVGNTGVIKNPLTGKPTVLFLQPSGEYLLVAALNMEPILKVGRHIHFGDRGHCVITDQFGNVVLHPNSSWIGEMRSIADWPIVQAGLQGGQGIMTFFSPFLKAPMIAGYASVPEFNWVILTPQPLSELTADARILINGAILFGMFGLAAALILALFLTNWITKPIGTLVEGVKRIRENKFTGSFKPLGKVAPKEIEVLRDYSIHMAESVRETLLIRDELNRKLEHEIEQATKELTEANTKLLNQVHVDELTGLKNRRALWEHLADMEGESEDTYLPIQVMLFDVDRFKQINDTYGHDAGDHVLSHVARLLEAHTREMDFVVRYGGDEFLVVLPKCTKENARRRAEAIREAVVSSPLIVGGNNMQITLSIGIAGTSHGHSVLDFSALLKSADQAMYQSKQTGRNKVSVL